MDSLTCGLSGTAHGSGSGNGFSNPLHLPRRLAPTMSIRQAELSDCVTPSLPFRGTGMLTGCPSPTARALGLGPTNPTRITLASEPLDFRRRRFSRRFRYSSQHSHFRSLQWSSPSTFVAPGTLLYQRLGHLEIRALGCPSDLLTERPNPSVVSVSGLSPVIFSAQDHLTSELLRTL